MFYFLDFHVGADDRVRRFVFMVDSELSNNRYKMQCVAVNEENQGCIQIPSGIQYIAKGDLMNLKMRGMCFGEDGWDLELTACLDFPAFENINY